MKHLILLVTIALLAACGHESDIAGSYVNHSNGRGLNFQSNGTVTATNDAGKVIDQLKFVVEGDQVKVGPGAVFSIAKDGSLDGGSAHGRYVKK